MAQSRSGKKRSSTARKTGTARKGGTGRTTYKKTSRRAQRRQERINEMWSIPLAGIGLLMIAMVLVRGQSFWLVMRSAMFGVFGIATYFIGPLLLYLAYLVASRYQVGKFTAKTLLMALMVASVPVVFSAFPVHTGDSAVRIIKDLYLWGQTYFWSGGVFGGLIGGTLLAFCGRPAANIFMILLFLVGLMVFFAITPLDVVQFFAYQQQRWRDARAAAASEETAYDTQLFNQGMEEEPLENLTESLPAPAAAPLPGTRSGRRAAFDVGPYLEKDRQAAASAQAVPAAPAPVAAPVRSEFDVDLGPDVQQQLVETSLKNDPLAPVVIGPGGTFGMDPLEAAAPAAPAAPARKAPVVEPEESAFEQRLDTADARAIPEPAAVAVEETSTPDELDELIRKAMGDPLADAVGEVKLDLPVDSSFAPKPEPFHGLDGDTVVFDGPITPDMAGGGLDGDTVVFDGPLTAAAATGAAAVGSAVGIPTIGGSFEVAKAAWNAGIPMTDVLAGRAVVPPVPAAPPLRTDDTEDAAEEDYADALSTLRPQEDAPAGNSEIQPISSPPNPARAARLRAARAAAQGAGAQPQAAAPAGQVPAMVLPVQQEPAEPYCYPSLNLFNPQKAEDDAGAAREMKKNADILVNTLDSFGVKTRILDICRGPSVTRYELQPQAGVKISRITNLADDIALNLATAGVRIEAPIPGKPAVGIEVPNRLRSAVNIRGVFESQSYINAKSPLTMALGKDIAGTAQCADLCKMPHLLVAGSTGSGKSVCINSIIISFLFRSGPEDCKLILIDPKVVELAEYNGIPHLLMPVVTEPRKAAGALGASVAEMERRYKLFAENNVRDIKTYNKLAANHTELEHLPYIAIVIDELADLMMVAGKEVEDYICRIAQKARAAGIHLIIATQRPSVDVITGLIKANIPSRIAFAVSSQIDSRTILDGGGAEKLLGNGDMLFLPVGAPKPTRIQGTFVTDDEISAVLNFIKTTSSAQYDEEMIAEMERRAVAEGKGGGSDADDADAGSAQDAMFDQAVECVVEAGQASTSLLQRRCKLGYARAARIMDQMEQAGVIGPYEGSKPRTVLITRSQWQERKLGAEEN